MSREEANLIIKKETLTPAVKSRTIQLVADKLNIPIEIVRNPGKYILPTPHVSYNSEMGNIREQQKLAMSQSATIREIAHRMEK